MRRFLPKPRYFFGLLLTTHDLVHSARTKLDFSPRYLFSKLALVLCKLDPDTLDRSVEQITLESETIFWKPFSTNILLFEGAIPEFVNPKYKDEERTQFKKPTRLECMMQESIFEVVSLGIFRLNSRKRFLPEYEMNLPVIAVAGVGENYVTDRTV